MCTEENHETEKTPGRHRGPGRRGPARRRLQLGQQHERHPARQLDRCREHRRRRHKRCGKRGDSSSAASGQIKIGVSLTYNNTAFWAAYINYEQQYAQQMNVKLLGPLLSAASASVQNQQIEQLVNEGAQAIIVNPETATSLGPAITYANAHNVQLVSVDTIVGAGKVYMVVRASNTAVRAGRVRATLPRR